MEEIIKEIIEENIPDAVCYFEGDSCNLKLTVTSDSFKELKLIDQHKSCLLYTSPSPRDLSTSRMPSSA